MFQRLSLIFLLIIMASFAFAVQADTSLPASAWYAVAWVRDTDSLHWINANGEQGSIPRPTWTDEAANTEPWIHISADGRILVQIIEQANGFEGIGFYDIQAGQFLNVHQAQADEHFILTEHYPSTLNSSRFAIGLSTPNANAWRILSFDINTGNAIAQVTSAQMETGLPANQYYPYVVHYGLDEGLGQTVVYFQMHTQLADASYMMYYWYPELVANPQVPNTFGLSLNYNDGNLNTAPLNPQKGYDLQQLTGFPILVHGAGTSANQIQGVVNGVQGELAFEVGGTIDRVRWLNNAQWIGYHYQNGVQNDHWRVMPATPNAQAVPMGPNFSTLYATPDGFLAMDGMQARLMHVTNLNFEGFAAEIGTSVFQPFAYYRVVYVTAMGANFTLQSIPTEAQVNVPVVNDNVQAPPQTCGTAPSPRLTVGQTARVSFTDGTSLNLRTAPSGEMLMQIAEGTIVSVIEGPVCNNNYYWWNLQFESQGVTVGGWAAEGDSDDYFLEPYNGVTLVNPPVIVTVQPTVIVNPPLDIAPVASPTSLGFAPVASATPALTIQINCNNSPASRLQVGMQALVVDNGGTLSFYSQANSPEAILTLPANQLVNIIAGPQCRSNGSRMWQVETTYNGQTITGWVSEGFGQTYYLRPRPARANN